MHVASLPVFHFTSNSYRLHVEFLKAFEMPTVSCVSPSLHFSVDIDETKARTAELSTDACDSSGNMTFDSRHCRLPP